jgi:hypothetical protein
MNPQNQVLGTIARKFLANEIDKTLSRNQLPYESQLRLELESHAEIVGERDAVVRVRDGDRLVTLDERISQLRRDPRFSSMFPPEAPRVPKADQGKLRANFQQIAKGEIVVE